MNITNLIIKHYIYEYYQFNYQALKIYILITNHVFILNQYNYIRLIYLAYVITNLITKRHI